jgi:FHS family L-fucose permease-like MFS transporter
MSAPQKSYAIPMTIIGVLFFIMGFVTWVNGSLIPYLKIACQLETDFESFLVASAFFIAYGIMAVPASYVLNITGYKKGMAASLVVMAGGALLFIPAASSRDYNMFLIGLFIIGSGLALLQTASNPYVTIVGPIESAGSRISIMGLCNKGAGILAGIIFGAIALKDADVLEKKLLTMDASAKEAALTELAGRVIGPYTIIASVLVITAIAVIFSPLPDLKDDGSDQPNDAAKADSNKTSIFQFPHLFLGALTLFVYVGVEVMAGDTIISYGKSLDIELSIARYFSQGTLAFMMLGYVLGTVAIPKYFSQSAALKVSAILGAIFTVLAVVTNGYVSVAFIALLGAANALMWPAVWPLALDGLGKFTKIGSGLLVMAIAGGGIVPLIYGALRESIGAREAYIMMLPCYLYILYFATKGYKLGKGKA